MPCRTILLILLSVLLLSCAPAARPFLDGQDPNARLSFSGLTPRGINRETSRILSRAQRARQQITALKEHGLTLAATVIALDDLQNDIWTYGGPLYLMGYAHPDAEIRTAALASVQRLERFTTDMFLDKRLYALLVAFAGTPEGKALRGEYRKALADTLRSMRRSGLSLPDDKLAKVKALRNRLTKLGMEFSKHINDSTGRIVLKGDAETAGLPAAYLKARRQADGSYLVDLTYPSFFPFMHNARWEEGRKRLLPLYHKRAMEKNLPLLKEILGLRGELIALLGYKNYAEYVLVERMAKNSATVWAFLRSLQERLAPHARKDLALLTGYKRKETKDPAARLETWDVFYYATRAREDLFQLNMDALREYFPVPRVIAGLFRISQQLFGLDFRRVDSGAVWHKDVRLYEAFDSKTGKLVGRFYLDLYPRPGKYGHAAMFSMIDGKVLAGGRYQVPTSPWSATSPAVQAGRPASFPSTRWRLFFMNSGTGCTAC
jgi:thimet oligopeptidase